VYNGEVYNYVELREELIQKGHVFSTSTDTEVIVHLFEEEGPECVQYLNGQFAFAIWDTRRRELFLARDRLGIRPLHLACVDGTLFFASEIKALFSLPDFSCELDPVSLDQIFTFWTTLPGRTAFKEVTEVKPGCFMRVRDGRISEKQYWNIPLYHPDCYRKASANDLAEEARELLTDAVRLRLYRWADT
jgi:asparagine synthase (glutamine-hydrolysing)